MWLHSGADEKLLADEYDAMYKKEQLVYTVKINSEKFVETVSCFALKIKSSTMKMTSHN